MSLSMVISTTTSFNFVTPYTNLKDKNLFCKIELEPLNLIYNIWANPTCPKYLPILRAPLKTREGKPYHWSRGLEYFLTLCSWTPVWRSFVSDILKGYLMCQKRNRKKVELLLYIGAIAFFSWLFCQQLGQLDIIVSKKELSNSVFCV